MFRRVHITRLRGYINICYLLLLSDVQDASVAYIVASRITVVWSCLCLACS